MRVRLLLFIAVLLVAVVTLFLLLLATDTALSVWQRLSQAPLWLHHTGYHPLPLAGRLRGYSHHCRFTGFQS